MTDRPFSPAQRKALDFFEPRSAGALFARPGRGKSLISLELIERKKPNRVLILAPLFPALTVWSAEIEKWGYDYRNVVLHGKYKNLPDAGEYVTIVNYDALSWLRLQPRIKGYDMIIYDELSRMKNPGTKRFQSWRRVMSDFEYRIGLTGTPASERLTDMWGQMYCIDQGALLGKTVTEFRRRWCQPHPYIPYRWDFQLGAEQELYDTLEPMALSLDFEQGELPQLTYIEHAMELPASVRQAYNDMKNELVLDRETTAANAAVASNKLRQIAAGAVYKDNRDVVKLHDAKQSALMELLYELQGEPLLVFYEFQHDLDAINTAAQKVLGAKTVPALNGATKPHQMVEIVKQWNTGGIPLLAGHPKTASMGGNMQFGGSNVCFYTLPWSLEMLEQGIARLWRTGQDKDVLVHCLLVTDTKDYDVYDALDNKRDVQNKLFSALAHDGDHLTDTE